MGLREAELYHHNNKFTFNIQGMQERNWFVAYTHPRAERKVHLRIQEIGYESFLPLYKVKRVWSDRIKFIEVPLFSSYVFVQTFERNLPKLSDIYGISRFIAFQGKYAKVKEQEIKVIQQFIGSGEDIQVVRNKFRLGQKVRVKNGPFLGLEGLLIKERGKGRFIVEIEGLSQSLSVNIAIQCLEVLSE